MTSARLPLALPLLLTVACATSAPAPRPESPSEASHTPQAAAAAATPASGLYGADEALRDALSGQLEYLGTGQWPGINRMQACVFRNARVLIVNGYCTITETQAFRIDVYSPTRGRLRVYAEAEGPISERVRESYFTFTAESEPPPSPEADLPRLSLSMSFEQLRDYDENRYDAFLPACYGGTEHTRRRSGCLGALASREGEWMGKNRVFLERASEDWYRVVRELRTLAQRHGREPEH